METNILPLLQGDVTKIFMPLLYNLRAFAIEIFEDRVKRDALEKLALLGK
jgi:hypothetical protein